MFNMQLQLKISVIFSRILRNSTALAGAACVGGLSLEDIGNSVSRCHFSAEELLLCLDGPGSGRNRTVALQTSLLFLANRWLPSGKECLGLFPFLCCPF